MATTTIQVTNTYVKVADDGWLSIQNLGFADLDIFVGAALPADTVKGFIIKPLDMCLPETVGAGNIYAKARQVNTESTVAIGV